ncbi:uncharacterized protein LOC115440854 isoform X1 [Manduca sexta]|uniref:uncharacterized protein LOC115440854 isoform X1 n=1 Tax=Manduca sexta TaxID=7130 RepID=UPI0011831982|nr:uncharacterized protein LOC115440854 isoform X1 [Manduca sexta]
MISSIISRLVILVFGTLYPAYASYKAVRTKNLKEYVKWMMYWIVFALFTCTETFTDVFLSWFPFYYEVKIVLVLWLLSPATKGSSILYRKFVHPALCRREQEIDEYIAKAKDQGYHTVLNLGTKGVNYATTVIMQTAIKGGGGLVQQLRKSYSLSDLTECSPREERAGDEADDVLAEPRLVRRAAHAGYSTRRSASESNNRQPMYFPEVDVDVRSPRPNRLDEPDFSHIKSSEDISSGYSSADNSASLTRTASLGAGAAAARARARSARTTVTAIKRPQAAEESEVIIEELHDDDSFEYANMPPLINHPSPLYLSHSDPPFIYQYVGDQIKIVQILGNYPLQTSSNDQTNNTDHWDQKEVTPKEAPLDIESQITTGDTNDIFEDTQEIILKNENDDVDNKTMHAIIDKSESKDNAMQSNILVYNPILTVDNKNEDISENVSCSIQPEDNRETKSTSIVKEEQENEIPLGENISEQDTNTNNPDISFIDVDSAESDDEASFSTPDHSPKSKKKLLKGKYGKAKAPPPPPPTIIAEKENVEDVTGNVAVDTSEESLTDIIKKMPNLCFKDSGLHKDLQVVNPIAEQKQRHKSRSPGRIPKGNSSGIGKLLQLPSKLAFWNRGEDSSKSDNESTSSECNSRASTVEKQIIDEFQSCHDLTNVENVQNDPINIPQIEITDSHSNVKEALDLDGENINEDLKEKSDALQKLIDATIENHPEYKYIPLHEDISTTSKSTEV